MPVETISTILAFVSGTSLVGGNTLHLEMVLDLLLPFLTPNSKGKPVKLTHHNLLLISIFNGPVSPKAVSVILTFKSPITTASLRLESMILTLSSISLGRRVGFVTAPSHQMDLI